jgi:hypothetical protein
MPKDRGGVGESVYTFFAYLLGKIRLISGLKNNLIGLFYLFYP